MVVFNSENTLSRISWQLVQNFSVLVNSSAVLKAPQNTTPATKPASTSTPSPNTELGRRITFHSSTAKVQIRASNEGRDAAGPVALIGVLPVPRGSARYRYRQNHC